VKTLRLKEQRNAAAIRKLAVGGVVSGRSPNIESCSEELLQVVSELHGLLKKLLDLAIEKLAAMRAADAGALRECAARECETLERVFAQEQQRDAALARLAQSLRWEAPEPLRLSHVAEKIPEPYSSHLRGKTADLRRTATELRQKNRMAAEVARHLHIHLRAIFDEVASVNRETIVYGPDGQHEQRTTRTWVDAVG